MVCMGHKHVGYAFSTCLCDAYGPAGTFLAAAWGRTIDWVRIFT